MPMYDGDDELKLHDMFEFFPSPNGPTLPNFTRPISKQNLTCIVLGCITFLYLAFEFKMSI